MLFMNFREHIDDCPRQTWCRRFCLVTFYVFDHLKSLYLDCTVQRVALPPHGSGVPGLILSSAYCL